MTITNRFVLAGLGFGEAQVVLSKPAAPERPELAEAKAFLANWPLLRRMSPDEQLWEAAPRWEQLADERLESPRCAWCRTGRLASGPNDRMIRLWEVKTGIETSGAQNGSWSNAAPRIDGATISD